MNLYSCLTRIYRICDGFLWCSVLAILFDVSFVKAFPVVKGRSGKALLVGGGSWKSEFGIKVCMVVVVLLVVTPVVKVAQKYE